MLLKVSRERLQTMFARVGVHFHSIIEAMAVAFHDRGFDAIGLVFWSGL